MALHQRNPQGHRAHGKTVKRRAWDARRVYEVLDSIKEDELLHLAVHLAFVCSLRAGETAGIDLHTIDFRDGSLWITRQIQRVSDSAIGVLPKHEVLRIFPKQVLTSKSSMILKGPKTEDSHRKQYLTTPLLDELRGRLARIEENKAFFREEYRDYGLLICQTDGRPVDPKNLKRASKSIKSGSASRRMNALISRGFASLVRCTRYVCRRTTISWLRKTPDSRRRS